MPVSVAGARTVTPDIAGGPLIVALVGGKLHRAGPLLRVKRTPANLVLTNYGPRCSWPRPASTPGDPSCARFRCRTHDALYRGGAVLLPVGHYLLKIPYEDVVGVASGATGNPALLVYSTRMAPTKWPDIGYAMIFPSMTIVRAIAVQIVGLIAFSRPSQTR
jgi:putative transport protein